MKPGKIVSGQEADKTNEMLQVLANIIINRVDTAEAVTKVRNGEKPGKVKKSGTKEDKKTRDKSKSPVKTPSKKDKENKENKSEQNGEVIKTKSAKSSKEPMKSPQKIVNGNHDSDLTNGLGGPGNLLS